MGSEPMSKKTEQNAEQAEDGRIPVEDPREIPEFLTDAEELEFWRTHTLGDRFWAEAKRMTPLEALGLPAAHPKRRAAKRAR